MEILYLGHSCFKLKGRKATVVTDPFEPKDTGLDLPSVTADIVTVSHDHPDHTAVNRVGGTSRREKPYVIRAPGEYEVSGVGVFGWGSFHDNNQGQDRGKNTMYSILIDGVRVGHLGDLGHPLSEEQVENLGMLDVLLVPVGGFYTIDSIQAAKIIASIQPSYVIPMHYKTDKHHQSFDQIQGLEVFLKEMGGSSQELPSLTVNPGTSLEETAVVVLKPKTSD